MSRSYNTSSFHPSFFSFASCVFLQPLTPARRHVIRPAAKWSGGSHNGQILGQSSATSGVLTGDSDSAPSTSREDRANTSTARQATHTPVPPQPQPQPQPQPGSSSQTLSHPKPTTNSQQQDTTAVELHTFSSIQTPSTSTQSSTIACRATLRELLQSEPSTSGLTQLQAGASAHERVEPQVGTSDGATHHSEAVANSSTKIGEKASTSTSSQDNPQASTSADFHAQTQLQPHLSQAKEVKLVVVPQQPSIQASALKTPPQLQPRPQNLLQSVTLNRMQGNLIQIEPQPLAHAPAQPPVQAPQPPQETPVIPPAVLIAAAPERLGPPETGHRITLGSQVPWEAVPNPAPQAGASSSVQTTLSLHNGFHNVNHHAPPVIRNVLVPAERVTPALGLVAVPPAPEEIPRIEDARPGPSVPREMQDQQSLVRTLISGVVSFTSEQKHIAHNLL